MSKTSSSTKTKTVFIDKNKVISEIKIPSSINVDRVDFNKIKSFKINKGEVFERECDYEWNDKTISIYASNNGTAGMENQYDFPPPIDSQLYFGNVLVICHTNNKVENRITGNNVAFVIKKQHNKHINTKLFFYSAYFLNI